MNQYTQQTSHPQSQNEKNGTDPCVKSKTPEVQEVNEDLKKVVETEVLDI